MLAKEKILNMDSNPLMRDPDRYTIKFRQLIMYANICFIQLTYHFRNCLDDSLVDITDSLSTIELNEKRFILLDRLGFGLLLNFYLGI